MGGIIVLCDLVAESRKAVIAAKLHHHRNHISSAIGVYLPDVLVGIAWEYYGPRRIETCKHIGPYLEGHTSPPECLSGFGTILFWGIVYEGPEDQPEADYELGNYNLEETEVTICMVGKMRELGLGDRYDGRKILLDDVVGDVAWFHELSRKTIDIPPPTLDNFMSLSGPQMSWHGIQLINYLNLHTLRQMHKCNVLDRQSIIFNWWTSNSPFPDPDMYIYNHTGSDMGSGQNVITDGETTFAKWRSICNQNNPYVILQWYDEGNNNIYAGVIGWSSDGDRDAILESIQMLYLLAGRG